MCSPNGLDWKAPSTWSMRRSSTSPSAPPPSRSVCPLRRQRPSAGRAGWSPSPGTSSTTRPTRQPVASAGHTCSSWSTSRCSTPARAVPRHWQQGRSSEGIRPAPRVGVGSTIASPGAATGLRRWQPRALVLVPPRARAPTRPRTSCRDRRGPMAHPCPRPSSSRGSLTSTVRDRLGRRAPLGPSRGVSRAEGGSRRRSCRASSVAPPSRRGCGSPVAPSASPRARGATPRCWPRDERSRSGPPRGRTGC